MSSSGIIYAIIVGAWAVYLVPMWLRREDELNRARETQRYAAAIKVLANKEAFERRWAHSNEADDALPLAAGQGSVSVPRATKRASGSGSGSAGASGKATVGTSSSAPISNTSTSTRTGAKPTKRPTVAAAAKATAARSAVTVNVAAADNRAARTSRARTAAAAAPASASPATSAKRPPATRDGSVSGTGPKVPRTTLQTRNGLMARRRRVVALLFAISTLGALVSADLGARYLWVMAVPAVLLSAYIAQLRREERIRAAARVAKRAAAQEARAADLARAKAEAARIEAEEAEAIRAEAQAEAEHHRRTETARRRASAAARARAQSFTHEAPDLPQASNG